MSRRNGTGRKNRETYLLLLVFIHGLIVLLIFIVVIVIVLLHRIVRIVLGLAQSLGGTLALAGIARGLGRPFRSVDDG
jgi:hypothetical protein